MGVEFELKYRASEAGLDTIRAFYPGEYETISMKTEYYDTPAGTLSHRRWTLRHRQEGACHVCTLKTPGENGARGEWEIECPSIEKAIPLLAEASGCRELLMLTANGVNVACGARFTRMAKLLKAEGFVAELALDRGVLINGEKSVEFSEVELELKSGSRQALMLFGRAFAEKFHLQTETKSKFARAKALGLEDTHGL